MNQKTIRLVILFATVSLLGIGSFQLFWVNKAFDLESKQFNERVFVALNNVARTVQKLNKDTSDLYAPIQQIRSNFFIVSTNDTLHPFLLENIISKEFENRNIQTAFEYIIYDCFSDSIVFGKNVPLENDDRSFINFASRNERWKESTHYFGVYFPDKRSYIIDAIDIWIYSSIFMLIVMVFFSYTIWVILKQKRIDEIKTDFINNMTHELKTPISTISLSTDVLMKPEIINNPERLNTYARIIKEENNRLKTQVEKVLQMASLENSAIELEKKEIDIHELCLHTIRSFDLILKDKGGSLTTQFDANPSIFIGDPFHIGNVLFNLLDNAIKYSPKNPEIELVSYSDKKGIYLEIRDQGIGISDKDKKQIFDKFYRVTKGDLHDVKGYGLGLNYSKTMIHLHKGWIKLKNNIPNGSIFTIFLPFKP
jgi:two-component system phosphate regulon sensor histidine kinase PhoR